MVISQRIFNILQGKKMSQKEFSEKTGIPQSTISDWKTKKTNPTIDKIIIICDVLEIEVMELLTGRTDYICLNKDSDEYMIISQYNRLDNNNKERMFKYINELQNL